MPAQSAGYPEAKCSEGDENHNAVIADSDSKEYAGQKVQRKERQRKSSGKAKEAVAKGLASEDKEHIAIPSNCANVLRTRRKFSGIVEGKSKAKGQGNAKPASSGKEGGCGKSSVCLAESSSQRDEYVGGQPKLLAGDGGRGAKGVRGSLIEGASAVSEKEKIFRRI